MSQTHALILWLLLVTFVAVHSVYFPTTRYRAPVEFVLLFYAAVGIVKWPSTARTKPARSAP